MDRHPSQLDLIRFLSGSLDAEQASRYFAHVDGCEACLSRFESLRRLKSDFETGWEHFLDEAANRAGRSAVAITTGIELRLEGFLDHVRRLATAAVRPLEAAIGPLSGEFVPAYAGVGEPDIPGLSELTAEASRLWGEGRHDEAVERLEQAAAKSPTRVRDAVVRLVSDGEVVGEVVASSTRRSISVLVHPARFAGLVGEAVLTVSESGTTPRREPLAVVAGADYWLAEFDDVAPGAFSISLSLRTP